MKTRNIIFLTIFTFLTILSACNSRKTVDQNYTFDDATFSTALNKQISSLDNDDKKFYGSVYNEGNYTSYWFNNNNSLYEKLNIFREFANKSLLNHGILREKFMIDSINKIITDVDSLKPDYDKLAKAELLLSKSFYRYASSLQFGMVDPKKVHPDDYFIDVKKPDSAFFSSIIAKVNTGEELRNYLDEIQPKNANYLALQKELEYLYNFKDSVFTDIPSLPQGKILKVGEKSNVMPFLVRRLMITKRIPYNSHFDTVKTLTPEILAAVDKYRERYNLYKANGIDNPSIKSFNLHFGYLFWTIAANLERDRWKPAKTISNKHVWVNAATAKLRMMRGDSLIGYMDVGVGDPKHKTPMLVGTMYEVVLNPTWTVPNSIIANEISKKVMSDPFYLSRNNMRVIQNGINVSPYAVSWSGLSRDNVPFSVVQDAGPENSLGRLKFNFDNPFSVYLHDTNAKHVFEYHQRAVSHGCVRLERPLDLAFFCLRDIDPNNKEEVAKREFLKDQIRYTIDLPAESTENASKLASMPNAKLDKVKLKPGVSVIIDYRTAILNPEGKLFITEDYYKMDSTLMVKISEVSKP